MDFEPLDKHLGAVYVAHGAAADIWKIEEPLLPSGDKPESGVRNRAFIHKVLRVGSLSRELAAFGAKLHSNLWQDFLKDYHAKVDRWKILKHDNVVQVVGMGDGLNLKIDFYERGCVREYLKSASKSYPQKPDIITHVLNGLHYLHTRNPPIVHGNLNAGKLFIDATGTTKIGEFGLAALCHPVAAFVPSVSLVGLSRWLSPEMLEVDGDAIAVPTTASDIWALGCVLIEIVSGNVPYSSRKHDIQVQRSIFAGKLPGQFDKHFEEAPFEGLWPITKDCWERDPEMRPSTSSLLERAGPILQVSEDSFNSTLPPQHTGIPTTSTRAHLFERVIALRRSTTAQQSRSFRPDRPQEEPDEFRVAPNRVQLFDHRRDDPLRFALTHRKPPPAPSISGDSSVSLSDTRSLFSSASTRTSGTSASSASSAGINNTNLPLAQAAPTNPFLAQLKKTYRDLCTKESHIVQSSPDDDLDISRSGASVIEPRTTSGGDAWLRRVKDHKDLVEVHHSLLRMSLSPSVPLTIQGIPTKYNIPARLWSVGFHRLLEALRQVAATSPAALEHLIDYIYYAYGFYSCLFEEDSLGMFRLAWIEALGDLARYRMVVAAHPASAPVLAPSLPTPEASAALATLAASLPTTPLDFSPTPSHLQSATEFEEEEERDVWWSCARDWYALGLKDVPSTGKLHHHLGLLCRDDPELELRAAYHFVKAMTASHPFDTARDSIQPLFSAGVQHARSREADAGPVPQFILLLGLLFTPIQLGDFDAVLARFVERLEIEGPIVMRESEWIMIGVCCIGAVLEFGRPDGVIKARDGLPVRNAKPAGAVARRDDDLKREDVDDDSEDLSRSMQALSTSALASQNELPRQFTLAVRLSCAVLRYALRRPRIRATPSHELQYNPFLTITLTFLATLVRIPAVRAVIERHVPWAQLAAFSTGVIKRRAANVEVSAGAKGQLVSAQGAPLLEDWCVRGTAWSQRVYIRGFFRRPGRWSGESDVLDVVAVRDGVAEDQEGGSNETEDGAAILERGRCARLGAAVGAIVASVDGMRWEEGVADRSRHCLVEDVLRGKLGQWEREDREEEEEREKKRWGYRNRYDTDVNEQENAEEPEGGEDDIDASEEIRALKARRSELRPRAAPTSPRRPKTMLAHSAPNVTPGYTILVLDTSILLSALPTVSRLASSQHWKLIVPLAVVTELDSLAQQTEAAQYAISFLEAQVRPGQGAGLGLKVQTSRGNYLPSLAVRVEQFWGPTSTRERNVDDLILLSVLWQAENFADPDGFSSDAGVSNTTLEPKAKVVLVSSDRHLCAKARERGLETGDVNVLAELA